MRKRSKVKRAVAGTLKRDPNGQAEDYVLEGEYQRYWIKVRNLSVMVKNGDEGVSIEVYPAGEEDGDCITETWATYGEGVVDLCDCGHTLKEHGKKKCMGCDCPSFRTCD